MTDWNAIAEAVRDITGLSIDTGSANGVGGGCIHSAYRINAGDEQYFIKINRGGFADMFATESEGLAALAASGVIRVPAPVAHGTAGAHAFLMLEWIEMGRSGQRTLSELGEGLAGLHSVTGQDYGFSGDNYIGSTPQPNSRCGDWVEFWRSQRLEFQLRLARRNGFGGRLQKLGAALLDELPELLAGHQPVPSLLHGDLWGGNWGCDSDGHPVLFDPATYYGDREADLGMTRLFGGFGADFYQAYDGIFPAAPGAGRRETLYNLYHILNHLNLFGGGYLRQAETMMAALL